MPFDFTFDKPSRPPAQDRVHRGRRNYFAGCAAEEAVALAYERRGLVPLARRWRGSSGEVDLIFADGDLLVFVEVKRGPTHDCAAGHFTSAQFGRIMRTAEEYVGTMPRGSLTDMRFDLALVDGLGRIELQEGLWP